MAPAARPRAASEFGGDLEAIATAQRECNTLAVYAFKKSTHWQNMRAKNGDRRQSTTGGLGPLKRRKGAPRLAQRCEVRKPNNRSGLQIVRSLTVAAAASRTVAGL